MSARYTVRPVTDGNVQVWDALYEQEVCLCNQFEGERATAQERAQAIADILNVTQDAYVKLMQIGIF